MRPRTRSASATIDGTREQRNLTVRGMPVRAKSYNQDEMSFDATVATETPALVFDMRSWEFVEEILVAEGGEFPERTPLLDSHTRSRSTDVIGSALEFRRTDRDWQGHCVFQRDDPEVARIAIRVRDGNLRDVSIGYEVPDDGYVDIPAGGTAVVNGHSYTAGVRKLRVTTRWIVHEVSTTPIGADPKAKIRQQVAEPGDDSTNRREKMNKRLRSYLESIGLAKTASEEEARTFAVALKGVQRTVANLLDFDELDAEAGERADLAIRALGFDPGNPSARLQPATSAQDPGAGSQDPGANRPQQRQATQSGVGDDPARTTAPPTDPAEIVRQALADERERVRELREMAGDQVPAELVQRAIDESWDRQRAATTFLQSIRDRRGEPLVTGFGAGAPAAHTRNSLTDFNRDALCSALMMRGGIADPTERSVRYNDETGHLRSMNRAAEDNWNRAIDRGYQLRALPMVEICRRALEVDGIRVEPTAAAIGRAIQTRGAAAMSTSALLGIYTQTFGAILLQSYDMTEDTTQGWTIERENPNFLQNERHRIKKGASLTKHGKGGEAEHFGLDDTTEYTRIFRYSGQSVIDEMDLINDTMFNAQRTATPDEMGQSARRLRPDLVYAILLSNPNLADGDPLFNATFGNLLYEADFDLAALQAAMTVISTRQENGVNLNLRGRYVISPEAIAWDVESAVRGGRLITGSDLVKPDFNPAASKSLQVVSDSRLDNGVTDPNSGTTYAGDTDDWYVMTEGSRHTIEVTYRAGGSRSPEMRSGILDKGQFGIWFDVKHDIGGKALGREGVVKNTPTAEPS